MNIVRKYNTIIGRFAIITGFVLFSVITAGLIFQERAFIKIVSEEIIKGKQEQINSIADDLKFEIKSAIYTKAKSKNLIGNSYLYIIDTSGVFYYHPKVELINKNYSTADFFKKIVSLKSNTGNIHYIFEGISKTGIFKRIGDKFYVLTYNDSELYSINKTINTFLFIGMFVVLLLSVFLIFFLDMIVTNKIIKINQELKNKSNGDFTDIPSFWYKNENKFDIFHSLTRYTIDLFTRLSKTILDIKNISKTLENKFEIINNVVDDNEIVLKETVNTVNNIEKNVNNVVGVITEKFNSIQEDMNKSVEVVENEVYNQQAFTEESTAAVEQMVSNIKSINNNNNISKSKIDSLVNLGASGLEHQTKLKKSVENTILAMSELVKTNKLITNISNQTSILSINAAIESAHAGEYGKGFAVVSGEIGKLAENSAKQSKAIDSLTKELLKDLDGMSTISNITYNSYNDIIEVIKDVDRISSEISSSLQEQTTGSEEIVVSMVELKDSFHNVNKAIEKTSESSIFLKDGVKELNSSCETIKDSMVELTVETNKTIESSNKIKISIDDSSDALSDLIDDLKFFKIKDI